MSARSAFGAFGRAAVVLAVAAGLGPAGAGARSANSSAAAATIQLMVAGRSAVLFGPAPVTVSSATVTVGGRHCRVGPGTALAALAAARRARGPAFSVRDYSRCSGSARDAAGLFVYRIGGDVNRGQDGWVYKVDHRVGTTGAGDQIGPFGDGRRLRVGQRLLWFYCHMQSGGCQRTLEIRAATTKVAPGTTLSVSVTAYDDHGRATPAAGATVAFGTSSASVDHDGRATLTAPTTAGAVALTASAAGLVPAFPVQEQVG